MLKWFSWTRLACGASCVALLWLGASTIGLNAGWLGLIVGLVVTAAAVAVLVIPQDRLKAHFDTIFGVVPVVLGVGTYPFWYFYARYDSVNTEYFAVIATVLPVLLLATIVDLRGARKLSSTQLVLPIIASAIGELAALNVVAFGSPRSEDFAVVSSAIIVAFLALLVGVLADT